MGAGSRGEGDPRRRLPSVDHLLESPAVAGWRRRWGREAVKRALREALDSARQRLAPDAMYGSEGDHGGMLGTRKALEAAVVAEARALLEERDRPSLRTVLNGTGVVLHTNLGRAPLAAETLEAVRRVAAGYSNLEFDLEEGRRGSRYEHCAELLCELTGAGAALVVNNNAAAVSLCVNELARDREVVVSRGELVEIGGSFRIPDVVERSGGRLRAVGTTNRTRPEDYRDALGDGTGLILKVHPSNYRIEGFVEEASLDSLVRIGESAGVPVAHDLGSGLLRPDLLSGFPPEPSPAESLEAGADVVTWSGDKLLGGPQAGVILGTGALVTRLRRNPLLRAFRVDKMTLAALEATLRLYRDPPRAAQVIPALRALREPTESVERRAREVRDGMELPEGVEVEVIPMTAMVGGGAFPGHEIGSSGWTVRGIDPEAVADRCRAADPPLVGRIHEQEFRIDVRTLLPGQEKRAATVLVKALREVAGSAAAGPSADTAGVPGDAKDHSSSGSSTEGTA